MIRFFRRQRPTTPVDTRLSVSEARTAAAWGISEHEWRRLTDRARRHARENITKAPHYI